MQKDKDETPKVVESLTPRNAISLIDAYCLGYVELTKLPREIVYFLLMVAAGKFYEKGDIDCLDKKYDEQEFIRKLIALGLLSLETEERFNFVLNEEDQERVRIIVKEQYRLDMVFMGLQLALTIKHWDKNSDEKLNISL